MICEPCYIASMHKNDLIEALLLGEDDDWEFKDCRTGVGKSAFETVSAFANTLGGVIVFGIESNKADDTHVPAGISKPKRYIDDLWNALHNRKTISSTCCGKEDIWNQHICGVDIVCMRVPSADRKQRPVYVGDNPLTGTYKRRRSGDFRCDAEEVRQMLRDATSDPQDALVYAGTKFEDVDGPTFKAYRNVFASRRPSHPHLKLSDQELLKKLGGMRDRTQQRGLTLAGVLMFGGADVIRDVLPNVFLDYYERSSQDAATRYDDRVTSNDGDWEPNLFNFYYKAYPKLVDGLKIPFGLDADAMRKAQTPFHDALREALVNTLVHADYLSRGTVLIGKLNDAYVFQNPGRCLTPVHRIVEARHAGEQLSNIRNQSLVGMFMMAGLAERHGSGYPTIFRAWDDGHRHSPRIEEDIERNTVTVTLPLLSQIAPEVERELRSIVGAEYALLSALDRDILVQAYQFRETSNEALQFSRPEHPRDIGARLKFLCDKGWLKRQGPAGRGRTYKFVAQPTKGLFDEEDRGGDKGGDRGGVQTLPTPEEVERITARIRATKKAYRPDVEAAIVELCRGRFLTPREVTDLLGRKKVEKVREDYLTPMVGDGRLVRRFPDAPGHRSQAYRTAGS
jgi:ATP-dependent DNA helicase RecG